MSDGRPGEEDGAERGPVGRGLATAIRGNSTAFGYSILITTCFGLLTHTEDSPDTLELFLFGVAAALAVGLLEGLVSRGFRSPTRISPPEVRMLGTALDAASVAVGLAVALGVTELIDGMAVWPVGAFAATAAYVLAEAVELMVAERIQVARGDRRATQEEP